MNQETIKQVKQELQPLIDKLGEGAQFTYETLHQQVINEAIVHGSIAIAVFVLLAIFSFFFIRYIAKDTDREKTHAEIETDSDWYLFVFFVLLASWIFWLIIGLITIIESILTLMNPHYYTIERLLEIAQNGGQL